ncbi:MAG: hypothetical protein ACXABU_16585 [Candidatus Hodarchaeales archaeon]
METGSNKVFKKPASKLVVRGKPWWLAIIVAEWILGGLLLIILGGAIFQISQTGFLSPPPEQPIGYIIYAIVIFALGAFLLLIGIGLWQTKRKAQSIATGIYIIVLIIYSWYTIVGFMSEFTKMFKILHLHLVLVLLFVIPPVYLRVNNHWFQ